jgi:hypothetical protein
VEVSQGQLLWTKLVLRLSSIPGAGFPAVLAIRLYLLHLEIILIK